jgi:hypothetical protein
MGVFRVSAVNSPPSQKPLYARNCLVSIPLTRRRPYPIIHAMLIKGYAAKFPFHPAETQAEGLRSHGCSRIYVEGEGAETLETCCKSFRNEPGELWVFGGMRILGGNRVSIVEAMKDLKRRGIVLVDKMNNETSARHESEMLVRALKLIQGSAKMRNNRKFARKLGAMGGSTKGENAQAARDRIMAADIVRRLAQCPKLTWREKAAILGPPFNSATLRRNYS